MKEKPFIVEVGAGSAINLTGCGNCQDHLGQAFPRVVVLEPEPHDPIYKRQNDFWEKEVAAGRSKAQVVFGDIYQPGMCHEIPDDSVSLFALEDVVNDPAYPERDKDYTALGSLLQRTLVPEGVVLFTDFLITRFAEDEERTRYEEIQTALRPFMNSILDEINEGRVSERTKTEKVIHLLDQLGVLDEALEEGLTEKLHNRSWVAFQKKA